MNDSVLTSDELEKVKTLTTDALATGPESLWAPDVIWLCDLIQRIASKAVAVNGQLVRQNQLLRMTLKEIA